MKKDLNRSLFIRSTKTGSSALNDVFIRQINKLFPNKITVTNSHSFLDSEINKPILKDNENNLWFTIIRNPYLRAISCFKFAKLHAGWSLIAPKTFEEYLDIDFTTYRDSPHFRTVHMATHNCPQAYYLKEVYNQVDYFIRLETLDKDLEKLTGILNLPNIKIDRIVYESRYNKSEIPLILTSSIKDKIYKRYEEDFDLFKYPKSFLNKYNYSRYND